MSYLVNVFTLLRKPQTQTRRYVKVLVIIMGLWLQALPFSALASSGSKRPCIAPLSAVDEHLPAANWQSLDDVLRNTPEFVYHREREWDVHTSRFQDDVLNYVIEMSKAAPISVERLLDYMTDSFLLENPRAAQLYFERQFSSQEEDAYRLTSWEAEHALQIGRNMHVLAEVLSAYDVLNNTAYSFHYALSLIENLQSDFRELNFVLETVVRTQLEMDQSQHVLQLVKSISDARQDVVDLNLFLKFPLASALEYLATKSNNERPKAQWLAKFIKNRLEVLRAISSGSYNGEDILGLNWKTSSYGDQSDLVEGDIEGISSSGDIEGISSPPRQEQDETVFDSWAGFKALEENFYQRAVPKRLMDISRAAAAYFSDIGEPGHSGEFQSLYDLLVIEYEANK